MLAFSGGSCLRTFYGHCCAEVAEVQVVARCRINRLPVYNNDWGFLRGSEIDWLALRAESQAISTPYSVSRSWGLFAQLFLGTLCFRCSWRRFSASWRSSAPARQLVSKSAIQLLFQGLSQALHAAAQFRNVHGGEAQEQAASPAGAGIAAQGHNFHLVLSGGSSGLLGAHLSF